MPQLTVTTYHKTVPNLKSQEKIDVLRFFSAGVAVAGDTSIDSQDYRIVNSDVGVIQGWTHANSTPSPHINLRNDVVRNQLLQNKYAVAIDSNLFLYSNTANPLHYLRYSFNGVFPNTGIYCDNTPDPIRWQKISKSLNVSLKDYRTTGNHILLCLQRNGGWSMGDFNVQDWAIATIAEIRKYSDRPIVIRPHPGDKASRDYLNPANPQCKIKFVDNVRLSTNASLVDDLIDCWAAINYNSSPVVGAAIEGCPIFVTDVAKSQCKEIANTDLSQIENPTLFDRQSWVERLSMFHWNFDELKSGECWNHMRKYI